MPIIPQHHVHRISESEFKTIDYTVMGAIYDTHNELGRLFDESIYSAALYERLTAKNIPCFRELEIQVAHEDFKKSYYIDLLVHSSVPYELKTAAQLNRAHDSQLLHYLLLANVAHGKLINFRSPLIDGRFASTSLNHSDRIKFELQIHNWTEDAQAPAIIPALQNLLEDWGTHLATNLYQEALLHLLNSEWSPQNNVELQKNGAKLGSISPPRITPQTMLHVTSIHRGQKEQHEHLTKLLAMSDLKQIQWINFNHHTVQLQTVT